jgi:hypothetical protein
MNIIINTIYNVIIMSLDKIVNKLFKKFYVWWKNISKGGFYIVDRNNQYKLVKTKGYLINPDIKYIVWAPMSSDDLTFFIYYILSKLEPKEIERILMTTNTLEYFINNFKRFFKKYKLFDNIKSHQYVLKGGEENTKNEKKIIKSLQTSPILSRLIE